MLEVIVVMTCLQGDSDSGRFFRRRDVDFWGRPRPAKRASADLWTEPTIGSDGTVRTYVPPREVVEFLESPTRENAERYLARQRERMEKLGRAMAALADLQPRPEGSFLYYFTRPGCPYCVEQDRVLASARLGDVKLVKVPPDSPLWARYRVRVTPTLVLVRPSRPPRVMEGYLPLPALEKEINRADR